MQQRETTTDRLADIIHVIRVGHRTGTLTVERGENVTFEEGMIVFVDGQVTQSFVGSRTGSEAVKWLSTWGPCRFRFTLSKTSNLSRADFSTSSGQTGQLPVHSNNGNSRNGRQPGISVPVPGAPYRTKSVDSVLPHMEAMGLSRIHRRLFLLSDGQRTVPEIARLMGKRLEEVQHYVDDLVNADFIRL